MLINARAGKSELKEEYKNVILQIEQRYGYKKAESIITPMVNLAERFGCICFCCGSFCHIVA